MKYSLVIPVYKNEASIPRLLEAIRSLHGKLDRELEVVFVVDGSPDRSYELLRDLLDTLPCAAQLLGLSRNFGSFAAIRTGLQVARGEFFSVMAADLQEPPELVIELFRCLQADECDVALGTRIHRDDPFLSKVTSGLFWKLYRRLVVPDMPLGGVDIFGCNEEFRRELLKLGESRSSLVALIFWLGFRRKLVPYKRNARLEGKSAWTWRKKVDYMMDSVFAFTDLPIKLLVRAGACGIAASVVMGMLVFIARISGVIHVPGYAATILIVLFFAALNLLGLGVIGIYAWRTYENSKSRPLSIVARHEQKEF
jgi:polyisoprenyl-phosphate glycosyltransferase